MRNISNIIVYIDDLLVHTTTHKDHLKVLEQVLERLHSHNLIINFDKCFFGNKEVSYLGFTLTPEGIKPSKNEPKAIKSAKPPTDIKTIWSFDRLCNFFRTHIKNFDSHGMIPAIKVARYPKKPWTPFASFKTP